MKQLFNPFSRRSDIDIEEAPTRPSFKFKLGKENAGTEVTVIHASPLDPPSDVPDLDAIAGYILQFAKTCGFTNGGMNRFQDNILDARNLRDVIYFADWEFSRRNNKRLTELVWYSSDYDYNINTASRLDVVLDGNYFDFGYSVVGVKNKNRVLSRISLKEEYVDHRFDLMLDESTRTHLEYIVASNLKGETRKLTFPGAYEPPGGREKTFQDLDLLQMAKLERTLQNRIHAPFLDLRKKRFDHASFDRTRTLIQEAIRAEVEGSQYKGFLNAFVDATGTDVLKRNTNHLYVNVNFKTPLFAADEDVELLKENEETFFGEEYRITVTGKTGDIYADMTDEEYDFLSESQRENFVLSPDAVDNDENQAEDRKTINYNGRFVVQFKAHVTFDVNTETVNVVSVEDIVFFDASKFNKNFKIKLAKPEVD